jgi:hypothetical protein
MHEFLQELLVGVHVSLFSADARRTVSAEGVSKNTENYENPVKADMDYMVEICRCYHILFLR